MGENHEVNASNVSCFVFMHITKCFAQRAPDYFQTAREAFYNEEYTNAIVSLKSS